MALALPAPPAPAAAPYKDRGGVLLLGDSMMAVGVGPELKKALERQFGPPVDLRARGSTGLVRSDVYDWHKMARQHLQRGRYRSVVVYIGANDCQAISEKGRIYRFGTAAWDEIYAGRLTRLVDLLCENERKVYWIALPPMKPAGFNRRIAQLTQLTKRTLAGKPCVRQLSPEAALTDGGRFAMHVRDGKKRVKVRDDDGIHMTPAAGRLVSKLVIEAMAR